MSPVTIEAVYERVPTGPERRAPARVRLGFRARFSAAGTTGPSSSRGEEGVADPSPPPREASILARRPGAGPRKPPREASPDPSLLGYAADGGLLPLDPAGGRVHGSRLDLLA